MNRDMLGRRLSRRDFEVIFAFDGQEGLDKMKSENPDLVLMDMGLPVLDGWEATTILQIGEPASIASLEIKVLEIRPRTNYNVCRLVLEQKYKKNFQ